MLIATFPSTFSAPIDIPVARGPLGSHLFYSMYSPLILKIGTNTTINFTFTAGAEVFVKAVRIEIYGSAFEPIPDFHVSRLAISNQRLNIHQSVNYSVMAKPLTEGHVIVRVSAEYTFNDESEGGYYETTLDAKPWAYEELRQTFQYAMYVFGLSSVALIIITLYLYFRQRTTRANKDATL